MSLKSKRLAASVSLFLVFAVCQVYIGVSFAGPGPAIARNESPAVAPQQPTGILSTQGNKAITVNGASAIGGATIVSGANIETPDEVGATVNLGARGSVEIAENTKLTLEFSENNIKVMLFEGCVTVRVKKGSTGEIDTPQGVADKTTSKNGGVLNVCLKKGGTPVVTAATAAAGAGAGGLFGLGTAATIAIIAGGATAVIVPVVLHGRNPSPSNP